MRTIASTSFLFLAFAGSACQGSRDTVQLHEHSGAIPAQMDDDDDDDESEVVISPDDLPPEVRAAALAAVPGLVITEAEEETEGGELHYCVHGTVDGDFVEVEVSADGKETAIEDEEDDEEDDEEEGG